MLSARFMLKCWCSQSSPVHRLWGDLVARKNLFKSEVSREYFSIASVCRRNSTSCKFNPQWQRLPLACWSHQPQPMLHPWELQHPWELHPCSTAERLRHIFLGRFKYELFVQQHNIFTEMKNSTFTILFVNCFQNEISRCFVFPK